MSKVAVITGVSAGIGEALAGLCLKKGYRVYGISRRPAEAEGLRHIAADVTDEEAVLAAFSQIYEREGKIDLLLLNAGMGISGAVEFTELEDARRQMDVNFFGSFLCARAAIPYMRKEGGGRILFVSSLAAQFSLPFQAFYSASKAAVCSLALALANELRQFGISVAAVLPGDTKTDFTAARKKDYRGDDVYGGVISRSTASAEKDEENGMSIAYVAKKILAVAEKKKSKPFTAIGMKYKLFMLLVKILPLRLANWVVGKMYMN